MDRFRFLCIALLASWLVMGCGNSGWLRQGTDSPYYLPPAGSIVSLKKPLAVPAGHTRVFLQRGEMVSKSKFDRYRPNCNFEVRTLAERTQTIQPEDFLVVKVQQETEEVVRLFKPIRFAGLGLAGMDDGTPMIVRGVHMWLGSDIQPDVMRLTCRGAFADMWDAQPPRIAEMRDALGDYVVLELP